MHCTQMYRDLLRLSQCVSSFCQMSTIVWCLERCIECGVWKGALNVQMCTFSWKAIVKLHIVKYEIGDETKSNWSLYRIWIFLRTGKFFEETVNTVLKNHCHINYYETNKKGLFTLSKFLCFMRSQPSVVVCETFVGIRFHHQTVIDKLQRIHRDNKHAAIWQPV